MDSKNSKDRKKKLVNINDFEDKLLISKEKEISKNIHNKSLDKIKELTEKLMIII